MPTGTSPELQIVNITNREHLSGIFAAVSRKTKTGLENLPVTGYAAEGRHGPILDGKSDLYFRGRSGRCGRCAGDQNKKTGPKASPAHPPFFRRKNNAPSASTSVFVAAANGRCFPEKQLAYKQQEAEQNLRRIGKTDLPAITPIAGSEMIRHYRNKLEFTFSNKRYLLPGELEEGG